MVQLPLEVSKVNATHEFLDSHKAWQASTFLNFLDVLTVAIFPLNKMFSFGSKFMSAASMMESKNKIAIIVVNLIHLSTYRFRGLILMFTL